MTAAQHLEQPALPEEVEARGLGCSCMELDIVRQTGQSVMLREGCWLKFRLSFSLLAQGLPLASPGVDILWVPMCKKYDSICHSFVQWKRLGKVKEH